MSCNKQRVILDVAAGLDDAYAILFFLYAEKQENLTIEAITCTMGNTGIDHVCRNVVRLLEIVGRTDIPVYRGASEAIIKSDPFIEPNHYLSDGFLDLDYETEPNLKIIKDKPASIAMRDIVMENPGEISLICLGPLTNVALAIKTFDDFISHVKDIFIMGGNYMAIGNRTRAAEFNFYEDPEAAHIVLKKSKCPTTIFVYEAGIHSNIEMDWRFDVLESINTPIMKLLNEVERKFYSLRKIRKNTWHAYDFFSAITFVYPEKAIKKKNDYHATVELSGCLTRGQMVLDHLKKQEPNVTVIEAINEDFVKEVTMASLKDTLFQPISPILSSKPN